MDNISQSQPTDMDAKEEKNLYKKASQRAGFKINLILFFVVSLFLWIVWFFVFKNSDAETGNNTFFEAVLFVTIIWLLVIFTHYMFVYKFNKSMVDKELAKLKKERQHKMEELKKMQDIEKQEDTGKQNNQE